MITLRCPGCQTPLRAAETQAGKQVRCPRCARVVDVPAVAPPRPPVSARRATERTRGEKDIILLPDSRSGVEATDGDASRRRLTEPLAPPQGPGELGRLGPYRILEILGFGGMGVVYKAEDPQLRRAVALKAILPSLGATEVARKRFLREARSAAAIEHDHIVPVYHVGEDRGVPFLAMQLLKGESLARRLEREPILPPAEVVRIGRETALGLAAAHQRGLIHRDVKPANLWLESPTGRVKILDFGLAREADGDTPGTRLTQLGAVVGTPAFMAPEQANGGDVDARADLFSLGCVLYRLASGVLPFHGPDAIATAIAVLTEIPRPPHEVNPNVPADLSSLIMRLLEKDRERRPASAQELAELLRPPKGEKTAALPRGKKPARLQWAMGAAAVLILAAGGVWLLNRGPAQEGSNPPPPDDPHAIASPLRSLVLQPTPLPGVRDWALEPNGHRGRISRSAFAPDSKRLATCGVDGTVRLWEVATGRLLRIFLGHTGEVWSVAWSPDGTRLATGSQDKTVRVWQAATGREVHLLTGHTGPVTALAWSADGTGIASGSTDRSVRVWDAGSGQPLGPPFTGHGDAVTSVAWWPDGRTLVSGSKDGRQFSWEAKTAAVVQHHTLLPETPLAWSADSRVLAFRSGKAAVAFWEADTGWVLPAVTLKELPGDIAVLAWSPDRKTLVTGTGGEKDGAFQLWDAGTGNLLFAAPWNVHSSRCNLAAFSADGQLLLTCGKYEFSVGVWKAKSGKKVRLLSRTFHVWGAAFSPDAKCVTLTMAGERPAPGPRLTLDVWELTAVKPWRVPQFRADCQEVAWSPDGLRLAGTSVFEPQWGKSFAQIRVWDDAAGKIRQVLTVWQTSKGGRDYPSAWSPDRKVLATSADEFAVRLWDPLTGAAAGTLAGKHTARVHALAWSPDGKALASIAQEGWLWDPAAGQPLRPLANPPRLPKVPPFGHVTALAWSPDGKTLAGANRDWNEVDLWDVGSGQLRLRLKGHRDPPATLAWSPDGQTLASGGADRTVRLWQDTGGSLAELADDRQGPVAAVAWLDGQTLATFGKNNRLCLWDVASRKLVRDVHLPARGKGRFSPDGRLLASLDDWAGVHLWETATGRPRGTLFFLARPDGSREFVALSADGNYLAAPPQVVEREFVVVVRTDQGQELLTPAEFARKYRRTNDPHQVRLLAR